MRTEYSNRSGQTIIELLMALSVFIIGFLGIISLLSNSLGYNRLVTDTQQGTYLAAEGIELVRNAIDNNLQERVLWRNGMPVGSYEVDYLDRSDPDNANVTFGICHYFQTFNPTELTPLYFDSNTNSYSYDASQGVLSPYTREILIDYYSVRDDGVIVSNLGADLPKKGRASGRELRDDIMVVRSIVRWTGGGGRQEVIDLEDHFYNWQDSDAEERCNAA